MQELYDPAKVKDGVFQAMMQVKLVNDGPVGIDYRSDDGAVIQMHSFVLSLTVVLADMSF